MSSLVSSSSCLSSSTSTSTTTTATWFVSGGGSLIQDAENPLHCKSTKRAPVENELRTWLRRARAMRNERIASLLEGGQKTMSSSRRAEVSAYTEKEHQRPQVGKSERRKTHRGRHLANQELAGSVVHGLFADDVARAFSCDRIPEDSIPIIREHTRRRRTSASMRCACPERFESKLSTARAHDRA